MDTCTNPHNILPAIKSLRIDTIPTISTSDKMANFLQGCLHPHKVYKYVDKY